MSHQEIRTPRERAEETRKRLRSVPSVEATPLISSVNRLVDACRQLLKELEDGSPPVPLQRQDWP